MPDLKLNDLRRYAILRATAITFRDGERREARVNDSGIAEIPGIKDRPAYRVDEVLEAASEFELGQTKPRRVTREQMIELVRQTMPSAAQAAAHHEDE